MAQFTTSFSLDVFANENSGCSIPQNISIQTTAAAMSVPCVTEDSGTCPSLSTTTGQLDHEFIINKMDVAVEMAIMSCSLPGEVSYEMTFKLDSIDLSANDSLVFDLYCLDNLGMPTTLVDTFTVQGPLTKGMTYAYRDTFTNSCDLSNGVMVVLQNTSGLGQEQCFCEESSLIMDPIECLYDYGDLPDMGFGTLVGDYQTLYQNNGPVHLIVPGLLLGALVDDELDGSPNSLAIGDDLNGDDEDGFGIMASMNIQTGITLNIPLDAVNNTGTTAHVEAWIDWNGDGDFNDIGEMIANLDDSLGPFPAYISTTIPASMPLNQDVGVRIRISHMDNMTPYGVALSGEIEDYVIRKECPAGDCHQLEVRLIRQ